MTRVTHWLILMRCGHRRTVEGRRPSKPWMICRLCSTVEDVIDVLPAEGPEDVA